MEEVKPTKGLSDEVMEKPSPLESIAESNSIIAVTLLRIYDVLMCHYGEVDQEDAINLANLHKQGKIRSDLPWLDMS